STAYSDIPATVVRGDTYYIASGSYGAHQFNALTGTAYVYLIKAVVPSGTQTAAQAHGAASDWNDSYGSGPAVFSSTGAVWTIQMTYLSIEGMTGSGSSNYGIQLISSGTTEGNGPVVSWGGANSYLIMKHCELAAPDPNGNMSVRCFDERSSIYAGQTSVGE